MKKAIFSNKGTFLILFDEISNNFKRLMTEQSSCENLLIFQGFKQSQIKNYEMAQQLAQF